jgi:hypothetical protein
VAEKEDVFPAFFCLRENIKIKKGGTVNLNIIYLPLVLDTHKCYIIFKDKNAGEFQHTILGTTEEPKIVMDTIKFPSGNSVIYVDEPIQVDF